MVSITSGMRSRPTRAISASSAAHVHVALEGMPRRGLTRLSDRQVDGLGAEELDVGARGVEVRVVGNDVALFAGAIEQDALGGAALVRRDHMLVAEDVLNGIAEAVEATAAGIALVTLHDGRPLLRGHGAGAGVGEQVDEHIVGGQEEQVVVRGAQQLLALLTRGPADALDTLDAEWFDDGLGRHGGLFPNTWVPQVWRFPDLGPRESVLPRSRKSRDLGHPAPC